MALCVLALFCGSDPAESAPWLDFDASGGDGFWTNHRDALSLEWTEAGTADLPAEAESGPSGNAFHIRGGAGGFIFTGEGTVPVDILTNSCSFGFWIRPLDTPTSPVEFDIQFIEKDFKSRFWRKIVVDKPGWARVDLPLRFFRTEGARIPQWQNVVRFAIRPRGDIAVAMDNLSFRSEPDCGPFIDFKELRDIAMPDAPAGTVRLSKSNDYAIMTDSADLDVKSLTAIIAITSKVLRQQFPFVPLPQRPPTLVVFKNIEDYKLFPGRLAGLMGSVAGEPSAGGYTIMGIATSSWDPAQDFRRPVFVHEFTHAWLSQAGRMECDGRWLQEAAANYMQLKFYPQANFPKIVLDQFQNHIGDPASHLRHLTQDERIEMKNYWAVATLFRMMVEREPYASNLTGLFKVILESGSFDLAPHLGPVFSVDFDRLGADWKAFCLEVYGSAQNPEPAANPAEPTEITL